MRFLARSLSAVRVTGFSAVLLVGCTKDKSPTPAAGSAAPASAAPSAATGPAAAAPGAPAAVCTVQPEKVWAANASAVAGISQTDMDAGKVAFGVVLGGIPEVLVFDPKGEGEQKHVGVKKTLTEAIPKGTGRREIHRVTPGVGSGGEVIAFVDYEQIGKDHRTVACGPSDSATELLKFDGKPLVAVAADEIDPKPETPLAKPLASGAVPPPHAPPVPLAREHLSPAMRPVELARLADAKRKRMDAVRAAHTPAQAASAAPASSAAPAVPAAKSKPKGDKVRELRDCRTFVDHGGAHAWSMGSELVGQPQEDGSTEWTMEFFAEKELGRGKVDLTSSSLGQTPTKLPEFESPVALDLGNGDFSVATRFRGGLYAWLLDSAKHARGPIRMFPGLSPGAPRFATLGIERALLVAGHDASDHALPRALIFDASATQLPAALSELSLGGLPIVGSFSGAMLGAQRYLAVQSDESARRMTLLP
ncbi:MAG TPA: hypothetical protein VF395_06275, partial [Polyangiaceae bacterium]